MNDEDILSADGRDEAAAHETGVRHKAFTTDLSGVVNSARHLSAVLASADRMLEPVRHNLRMMESHRQAIEAIARQNTDTVYRAVRDMQLQYRASTVVPVLALQSDLNGIYNDWHRRINDAVRNLAPARDLLDQLVAAAALFLPANLRGLAAGDLRVIVEFGADDGLSLAWAPRTEIVQALLALGTREERSVLLAERRDDVLDDIDASLQTVTHPDLTGMTTLLSSAVSTARAGCTDGAQALAGNVLDTAMKRHGSAWIRRSLPQAQYPRGSHHGTITSALTKVDEWGSLSLLQFRHYLVLTGMRNVFGPDATQDTFNRHLGAHEASPDTYRPEFVLPALLLAHALLRALDQDLKRPADQEDEE